MALKYSRQRELIKNFLTGRRDHPTAEIVYRNVRQQNPNISLGTVYRNLTLLADRGKSSGCGWGTERITLMRTSPPLSFHL